MPNPYSTKPGDGNGCIVHAGILTPHGGDVSKAELTSGYPEAAKDKFIKEVVERLTYEIQMPFPCGFDIKPLPKDQSDLLQDLNNEKKYPDFHQNVLGHYRDVARMLDADSEFNLLPICDPIAFGYKLGVNIQIPELPDFMQFVMPNIPALALKLDLTPPELALKIPNFIPPLPSLPKLEIPLPLPNLKLPDLYEFKGWWPIDFNIKFGLLIGELIFKIPDLVIALITFDLPSFLGEVCKVMREKLFAKQKTSSKGEVQDIVRVICTDILARKIMEMTIIHAIAKSIGTAPSGITGFFSKEQGYSPPMGIPPDEEETPEQRVRRIISDQAKFAAGLCWSNDNPNDPNDRPYTSFIYPKESSGGPQSKASAYKAAEIASSCGMVARTCLARAGASFVFASEQQFTQSVIYGKNTPSVHVTPPPKEGSSFPGIKGGKKLVYDYFNDNYVGGAVTALIAIARKKGAIIDPPALSEEGYFWNTKVYKLPNLKKGDIIVIGSPGKNDDHVMVVVEDYNEGDDELSIVHGGQLDQDNVGTATYIKPPKKYVFEGKEDASTGVSESTPGMSSADSPPPPPPPPTPPPNPGPNGELFSDPNNPPPPVPEGPVKEVKTEQTVAKKGMRCTGIQAATLYTQEGLKKRGLKLPPFNLMPGPAIGLIQNVDRGVAGNGVIALGDRPIRALIDGAILVLGKKDDKIDTTRVGKNFTSPTEGLLPVNQYTPAVDSNDEQFSGTPQEIPLEKLQEAAKDPAQIKKKADAKKKKKDEEEAKKKASEEKKAANLAAWKK